MRDGLLERSIQLLKQISSIEIMVVWLLLLLVVILKWELQRYHSCRCTHLPTHSCGDRDGILSSDCSACIHRLNQLHSYELKMQWIVIHCLLPLDILLNLWKVPSCLSTATSNAVIVIRSTTLWFLTIQDCWAVPRDVSNLVAPIAHLLLVWWARLLGKAHYGQTIGKILNLSLSGSTMSSAIGQHHYGYGHISRAHILPKDIVVIQLFNCCLAAGLVHSSKE